MKNLLIILSACFIFAGCADKKNDAKAALDSLINIHDKVMGVDEQVVINKTALDSIVKAQKLSAKDTVFMISKQLATADSAMYSWMNGFKADYKGKTDDETTAYFRAQKKQIMALDSQLKAAVTASDKYLSKNKKK